MGPPLPEAALERVAVLAPVGRDASLVARALGRAGLSVTVCDGVDRLCREIDAGSAGAVLLTEEALTRASLPALEAALARQPPWSDLPLLVATDARPATRERRARVDAIAAHGTVTLLERPTQVRTLVSAVQAALRARRRQYELRDLLGQLERAVDERVRLHRQAEEASRLKDEFLATVSHELRTPLNAILGWAGMLRGHALPEEKRAHALAVIERNARAQAQLVEDLLDVSRIISGKLRLDLRLVSPANAVELAVESARPAAEARGVSLALRCEPDAGPVRADAERLQQIAWNLVNNAVKFTPRGGSVRVDLRRADPDVELVVDDTGQGVRPDFVPYLFERFRQADGSTTRAQGGLGLGLAIVRSLVEQHGGAVAASSDGENRGATFTVRLPLASPRDDRPAGDDVTSASVPPFECPPEVAGLRVLVVDDEPDARELVASLLARCRAEVTTAASAEEALASFRRAPPDVLVSDIGMPGEDGYALIRRVRALPSEEGGDVPAVAVTAYSSMADRSRALLAGFSMHVAKPVEPAELLVVLARAAGRVRGR
ncbi:MAG: ATP-binding protein [Polyangiales bacterium]